MIRGSALLERLRSEGLHPEGGEPLSAMEIESVATDSRAVTPGTLFCAIAGNAGDGHRFLGSAAAAGAVAALVEVPDPAVDLLQITVPSTRRAAAFVAAELYGDPWEAMTFLGVTGTNGKTTTAAILRHLLNSVEPAASVGTLGVIGPDGRPVPGTEGLTTPGPAQLAAQMRTLLDSGVKAVVMEASSHALDQDRIVAATFSAAIFTNLTRDHLDYHGTLEAYRAAKLKLVDLIRPDGVLAANIDDPAWSDVRREGVHLVRFGIEGRGEVQAEDVSYGNGGVEWQLHTPSCTARIHLPLFGTYNVYNALGAAAALWGLGWSADRIAEAIETLPQVPGRLESVKAGAGPGILLDFAHTPDALEGALKALRPLVKGRLFVVFGAGGDRDKGKRPEMGRAAAANADFSIVTTDNPRHEDPQTIVDEIEAGMGSAPRVVVLDRRDAIEKAIELATPDDVVLLAGKGHETYQVWGDEHRPFDERKIVREILYRKGIVS